MHLPRLRNRDVFLFSPERRTSHNRQKIGRGHRRSHKPVQRLPLQLRIKPQTLRKRSAHIRLREHRPLGLHNHENMRGMRPQIRPVRLPHLRAPHPLPRNLPHTVRVIGHMHVPCLRPKRRLYVQLKLLRHQRPVIDPLRKPFPLQHHIRMTGPERTLLNEKRPTVPRPGLLPPIACANLS